MEAREMNKLSLCVIIILFLFGCSYRSYEVPITITGDNNRVTLRVEAELPTALDTDIDTQIDAKGSALPE